MFLTRKFSIHLCEITTNYSVIGPVVHLSLSLRPSDTPKTISKTARVIEILVGICMYVHLRVYMCTCISGILYMCIYTYEFR